MDDPEDGYDLEFEGLNLQRSSSTCTPPEAPQQDPKHSAAAYEEDPRTPEAEPPEEGESDVDFLEEKRKDAETGPVPVRLRLRRK